MNRDERRERAEAPDVRRNTTSAFPVDPSSGGTWFAVNRFGLVFALLNRYDRPAAPGAQSRGRLITAALSAPTLDEACEAVTGNLDRLDTPFDLFVVSRSLLQRVTWNGRRLRRRRHPLAAPLLFTSSSERAESVRRFRARRFKAFASRLPERGHHDGHTIAGMVLAHFHAVCETGRESMSVCMQREAAHTKSICQAVVSSSGVRLAWWPEGELARHLTDGIPVDGLRPVVADLTPRRLSAGS